MVRWVALRCVDTAGLWIRFWSLGSKGQKEPAPRPLCDNKKLMWISLITFCHYKKKGLILRCEYWMAIGCRSGKNFRPKSFKRAAATRWSTCWVVSCRAGIPKLMIVCVLWDPRWDPRSIAYLLLSLTQKLPIASIGNFWVKDSNTDHQTSSKQQTK